MDEFINAHIDAITTGADMSTQSDGGFFDGWGAMLKDVAAFGLKSKIDAEYNAPTRLAERQMMMQADDGGMYPAGTVKAGVSSYIVPGLVVIGVIVTLIVVLKK